MLFAAAVTVLSTLTASASTISGVVGPNAVDYIFFNYTGGALTIDVDGQVDPMIRIFEDDGSHIGNLTGRHLGVNDDGGPGLDSRLSFADLIAGDYVLAIGEFWMSRPEARSGVASSPFSSRTYAATFSGEGTVSAVPLPASALLLIAGLAGLGAMRKRKS